MIYPIVLSGGSGTRLWPMSRTLFPKQLLTLLGRDSLLQQTVRRVAEKHIPFFKTGKQLRDRLNQGAHRA